MTYEFLVSLYKDLVLITKRIVVKRMDLAREAETTETATAFELYYACLNGSRYFYNFAKFDVDILEKYLSPADVSRCYYDPNEIPENLRSLIVEDQAQRVIATFEEKNEYYRMLAGMPRVDDHRWIYITDYDDIPIGTPIHQLSDEQIAHLEIRGKIDELKTERPDAKYLDYLGVNRIDVVTARLAKPFEILRAGVPTNANTTKMFEEEYYCARRYVMSTAYNRNLFTTKTLYDPIIGVIILTLAIRNTLVPTEAQYLNFEEILDAILESYGFLQYFKNFPYTYKKRLVMALDSILQVKGTDGVLVDICKIFSFDNFSVNRFYLMKTQPKDLDGNVIFSDDPDTGYELNFVKANIEDHEIDYSEENITSYESVVNNDYLWQLTEEERLRILQEDFNMMMTKYIDIEAAYDLSALTFEICYFINLLLQSRDNMIKLKCTNMYATGGTCPIYTMIVFLLATMAKRSGFDGNIVYDPEHIAQILRFDFGAIERELDAIVNQYEYQVDVTDKLVPEYEKVQLDKPLGTVNDLRMIEAYVNNRNLYDAILKEMHTTNDIRKYESLSNAKDCMYISAMEQANFKKSNGQNANTYYEMLDDLDPRLSKKLDSLDRAEDSDELDKLLLYILEKLEEYFNTDELRYLFLNTPNTYGTLIAKYLRTAINVFKASSVQLESINIFFNVGDSDPIRVIDQKILHRTDQVTDTIYVTDDVAIHKTIVVDDVVALIDKGYINE